MMQNRFVVLDSWRGICACMVALFHFHANNHFYDFPVFMNAGLFVDFFFVLSGFVIFINYQDRLKEGFGLGRFMLLRFGRLYPLHLATFLAFIGVELIQIIIPSLSSIANTPPFAGPGSTPDYILHNILLIHSFGIGERLSFNSPSWSISAEFYTYLIFGIILITLKRAATLGVVAIMLLSLTFLFVYGEFMTTANFGIFRCVYGFGAGALCATIWTKHHEKIAHFKIKSHAWNIIETSTVMMVILFVSLAKDTIFVYFAPFIFMLTIFIFSYENGIISSILKNKFCVFLGALSYSIYMNHAFIAGKLFILGSKLSERFIKVDLFSLIDGKERLGVEKWHGDLFTFAYLLVVILTSYVTYKVIEEPCRKYFKKLAENLN